MQTPSSALARSGRTAQKHTQRRLLETFKSVYICSQLGPAFPPPGAGTLTLKHKEREPRRVVGDDLREVADCGRARVGKLDRLPLHVDGLPEGYYRGGGGLAESSTSCTRFTKPPERMLESAESASPLKGRTRPLLDMCARDA